MKIIDIEADNSKAPIILTGVWIMTQKKFRAHINLMESIKFCVIIFRTNRDYPVLHSIFIVIFKHYWFR
jgi:hypothetical protein